MPQWIPQNLQKRLLLYVLQQLSLFSEIDLPNLEEVSLNSIMLRDVLIDPEKVGKLPGCNFRHGKVGQFELSGGVMGGVNVGVSDVEIVIAPDIDSPGAVGSSGTFLLAQSTADLASMMTDLDDSRTLKEMDEPESESAKKPSALGGVMARAVDMALLRFSITVANISVKIVSETADFRIEIDSVGVKTVNDVRNVECRGIRVLAYGDVNPGAGSGAGTPKHRGTRNKRAGGSGNSASEDFDDDEDEDEDAEDDDDDEDAEDDDDDNGYGDESLMDSMVFTHEEASSIYMSATSHSFAKDPEAQNGVVVAYIDEISTSFEGLSTISNLEVDLGTVRIAAVPAFPTIISVLASITRTLKLKSYQLRKENFTFRSKFPQYEASDEPPASGLSEEDAEAAQIFKKLGMKSLEVSLTLALTSAGTFSCDSYVISVCNLHVRMKSEGLVYGGVETIVLAHPKSEKVVFFEQLLLGDRLPSASPSPQSDVSDAPNAASTSSSTASTSKADIRFEWFVKETETEFTVLCSKPLVVNLSKTCLRILSNFGDSASSLLSSFELLQASLKAYNDNKMAPAGLATTLVESPVHVIFQSAMITTNLRLKDCVLRGVLLPISFKLHQNQLNLQKFLIYFVEADKEVLLTSVANIKLFTKAKEFKSYVRAISMSTNSSSTYPRAITLTSSLILAIPEIKISTSMKHLRRIISNLSDLASEFSAAAEINSIENSFKAKPAAQASMYASRRLGGVRRSQLTNSSSIGKAITTGLSSIISFRMSINAINIRITDVFPKFGSFTIKLDKFAVDVLRNGNIQGSLLSVNMFREFNDHFDNFIYEFTGHEERQSKYPLIVFSLKKFDKTNILDVYAYNFMIEYYTEWLTLLENEVHEQPPVDAVLEVLPEPSGMLSASAGNTTFEIKLNLYDIAIGLSPGRLDCKGFLCVSKGTADMKFGDHQFFIKSSFRDISVLLIDDVKNLASGNEDTSNDFNEDALPLGYHSALNWFYRLGCLKIGYVNVTHIGITVTSNIEAVKSRNDRLKIKDKLSILEVKVNLDECTLNLCADSAFTLVQLINDLKQPIVFLDEEKFKVSLNEGLNLWEYTGDIFDSASNIQNGDSQHQDGTSSTSSLNILDGYIPENSVENKDIVQLQDEMSNLSLSSGSSTIKVPGSFRTSSIDEEHFTMEEKASTLLSVPVLMYVNISKIHVRLYDGYDWKETRRVIRGAVDRVETKAGKETDRNQKKSSSKGSVQFLEPDLEDSEIVPRVIDETLFRSIHLSLPVGADPSLLTQKINMSVHNIRDEDSTNKESPNHSKLKLRRSKLHKLSIELTNLEVVVTVYTTRDPRTDTTIPKDGVPKFELVNSVEVNVESFEVLDNVPTSTWHKFIGYLRTAGERELLTKAFKLSLKNVRPNFNLCATEAIIDVSILPLRLYVDQDTLDFIIRFGEFKDQRFDLPIDDILYIQKFRIASLRLKLDYKPKKLDYAGIGSGRTSELVNLFVIDGSDLLLREVSLYGLLGFPKLGLGLLNVWAPDVQATQLVGLIAGLAPLRSIVNIGTGVKDLVAIPIKEYKKDGRLMRSMQKGAFKFAKTTGAELLKLGVKLAAGTQILLEQGEEAFGGEGSSSRLPNSKITGRKRATNTEGASVDLEEDDDDDEIDYMLSGSPLVYAIAERKSIENDLMASSQLLNQSLQKNSRRLNYGSSTTSGRKIYSLAEFDDEEDMDSLTSKRNGLRSKNSNNEHQHPSSASREVEDDESQKTVSLYSNQPIGAQEGLQHAYKSIGRNYKSTKVAVLRTRDAMVDAGSLPEAAVAMAKGAPVILIRPIIGATEVVQKTLLGLTNQIDPKQKLDSEEKYKPL